MDTVSGHTLPPCAGEGESLSQCQVFGASGSVASGVTALASASRDWALLRRPSTPVPGKPARANVGDSLSGWVYFFPRAHGGGGRGLDIKKCAL